MPRFKARQKSSKGKMRIGLNDGFHDWWAGQIPGRDLFLDATLHPYGNNMEVGSEAHGYLTGGILPPGIGFDNNNHWGEQYSPTQLYPASATDYPYRICVYNGIQWIRTDFTTPRSGVAPDPTDPTGAVSGWAWYPAGAAAGSVVGLNAAGWPTQHPTDTNLYIRINFQGLPKQGRGAFTAQGAITPGVNFTAANCTITAQNVAAGTFTLSFDGTTANPAIILDRTTPLGSNFFVSAIPSYETGTPSADIGAPYVNVDKISDFTPFYAMRNMTASLTNRPGTTPGTANARTAANYVPTGGRREWMHNVSMANAAGHKAIWTNVIDVADTTFNQAMAAYYLAKLNPGIAVYLERGNEMWNGAYGQAQDLATRATALSLTARQLHAREVVAVGNTWKTAWGSQSKRIKTVLAWQATAPTSFWQDMLDFENAYQSVDAISIAAYFALTNFDGNGRDVGSYTNTPQNIRNAVANNDQTSFDIWADVLMRECADFMFNTYVSPLYKWLRTYCVSKGLPANAIEMTVYEASPEIQINGGAWDAGIGAGMGTRAQTMIGNYRRSGLFKNSYAYYLNRFANECPLLFMAFDYNGDYVHDNYGHLDRVGATTQEPYATLKAKALAWNS